MPIILPCMGVQLCNYSTQVVTKRLREVLLDLVGAWGEQAAVGDAAGP